VNKYVKSVYMYLTSEIYYKKYKILSLDESPVPNLFRTVDELMESYGSKGYNGLHLTDRSVDVWAQMRKFDKTM
jgi:hypothetical protein